MVRRLQICRVTGDLRISTMAAFGFPDIGAPLPVRFSITQDGQDSFQDTRFRGTPAQALVEANSFAGRWTPLPWKIHSKRSGSATETAALDLVATVFNELAGQTRRQEEATEGPAAAVAAEAADVPVFLLPYQLSTKRPGYSGSGAFKIHIMPHPYPCLNVLPATYIEVYGYERWRVPPKRSGEVLFTIGAASGRAEDRGHERLAEQAAPQRLAQRFRFKQTFFVHFSSYT